MVTAFLNWDQSGILDGSDSRSTTLEWNERYVMLLWISQLLLAPFDLSSLSAPADLDSELLPFGIQAEGLPQVAKEVLQICHSYLGVGSKEREAAGTLLVRLLLRPDMRNLHLLEDVVQFMTTTFSDRADSNPLYAYVGYLSFLSKLFSTTDVETVAAMIAPVSSAILKVATGYSAIDLKVQGSALARKIIVKVLRGCVTLLIQHSASTSSHITDEMNTNINNEVIDHLLTTLGDQDTPVRYAASKALAIIALKLEPEMSLELVNVIIESLEEDIRRIENDFNGRNNNNGGHRHILGNSTRDFAAVDQFRWHGITLTLSQLLFRRSPPPELLPRILDCLVVALSFEQRSSTGGSLGTSVRDVACFGIWSISRKYTTAELLAINQGLAAAGRYNASLSTIQILAAELTVTATLDPAGNIRRGSSAALQELVGRHPGSVHQGISLIQIVDYHAVARRTVALTDIALGAAKLDQVYTSAISNSLFGWRGLQSADLESRRAAAKSLGILSGFPGPFHQARASEILQDLRNEIFHLQERNVDERHGYMLAVASVLDNSSSSLTSEIFESCILSIFNIVTRRMLTAFELRPEITAEACCVLVASTARAIQKPDSACRLYEGLISRSLELLNTCVLQNNPDAVQASSKAAFELAKILDSLTRSRMITEWTSSTMSGSKGANREPLVGIIEAIGATFTSLSDLSGTSNDANRIKDQESILDALISVTNSLQIEARVAGLHAIARVLKSSNTISAETIACIGNGLNDYTVDERGDIGSHVRIAALEATQVTFTKSLLPVISATPTVPVPPIYPEILRLAGEKLDKVRGIASQHLFSILPPSSRPIALTKDVSSAAFFLALLTLPSTLTQPSLTIPVFTGLLPSAASGSQTVATASRTALLSHLASLSQPAATSILSTFLSILRTSRTDDRLALPTLITLGFLLDAAAFGRPADFSWRALYVATAKAHLKSKSSPKVEAAVRVYVGLYRSVPEAQTSTRKEILAKLGSMLVHPFRQVRLAVVEGLWELCIERGAGDGLADVLEKEDWGRDVKGLKETARRVQLGLESWN